MPCIGILGCRIRLTHCPKEFQDIIFNPYIEYTACDTPHSKLFNPNLKLSSYYHDNKFSINNSPLKIYTIKYHGMVLNMYINSYKNYIEDYIYIINDLIMSDVYSHCDNGIQLQCHNMKIDYSVFHEWVDDIKKYKIDVSDSGFFVLEE
jgi:hypothetical protein